MSAADVLNTYAKTVGLQLAVKTNLGPEMLVYNADAPQTKSLIASMLKAGIVVRDRNGNIIASEGGYPKTNPALAVSLFALAGLGLFFMARGIKTTWK